MTTLTNEMQQVLKLQDTYAKQLNVELENTAERESLLFNSWCISILLS